MHEQMPVPASGRNTHFNISSIILLKHFANKYLYIAFVIRHIWLFWNFLYITNDQESWWPARAISKNMELCTIHPAAIIRSSAWSRFQHSRAACKFLLGKASNDFLVIQKLLQIWASQFVSIDLAKQQCALKVTVAGQELSHGRFPVAACGSACLKPKSVFHQPCYMCLCMKPLV